MDLRVSGSVLALYATGCMFHSAVWVTSPIVTLTHISIPTYYRRIPEQRLVPENRIRHLHQRCLLFQRPWVLLAFAVGERSTLTLLTACSLARPHTLHLEVSFPLPPSKTVCVYSVTV